MMVQRQGDPRDLLLDALDEALKAQFHKLFEVLVSNPTPEADGRFRVGLKQVLTIYMNVRTIIEPEAE